MIKKFNFFDKNVCVGIYENTTCSKCSDHLDLRFSSEGSVKCNSCGEINLLKPLNQERTNDQ